MGLLGIPDPGKWAQQNHSSKPIVDAARGMTYLVKKNPRQPLNYALVKLHEFQRRYVDKKATNDKKSKTRRTRLESSNDCFPLRLVMIEHDELSTNFDHDVNILGHVNLMKVAGKKSELFLEQLTIRKDMRKQGYGSLLYTMVESFIKDVYQSDKIGIALTKDTLSTEWFFDRFKFVRVQQPIAFIEVAENALYKKVNGMLGLAKDAMKRKGDDDKAWLQKELVDLKLIGTPQFKRKQAEKEAEKQREEALFESRKAKSTYESTDVGKETRNRKHDFHDLQERFTPQPQRKNQSCLSPPSK